MCRPEYWSENNSEFVIEVSTGTPDEHNRGIFVMPIVSQSRYERLGYLFYPEYESMFADNDLCSHARQDGVVIDARHLMFPHKHPLVTGDGSTWDEAYRVQNRPEAFEMGKRIFEARSRSGFKTRSEPRSHVCEQANVDVFKHAGFEAHSYFPETTPPTRPMTENELIEAAMEMGKTGRVPNCPTLHRDLHPRRILLIRLGWGAVGDPQRLRCTRIHPPALPAVHEQCLHHPQDACPHGAFG